jgi:hypothetical protein
MEQQECCGVGTEWIKSICRQPEANISYIVGKVYIKPVKHLLCLTI